MANNRMWIRCRRCGEQVIVAKHFGGAWETRAYSPHETVDAALDAFFREHTFCDGDLIPRPPQQDAQASAMGPTSAHFELVYEEPDAA